MLQFGLSLGLLLAVAIYIYWPGLSGPLLLDDYANLIPLGDNGGVDNLQNFLSFVLGNNSGPTGRPVSMLSFLIDGRDWPPNVAAFKYTNILLHTLNGVVLCWFTLTLFQILGIESKRSSQLAVLLTALWLLHPLNSTTTLYVIQRMTQLMTLFSLAALLCYLKGRSLIPQKNPWGFFLLCAALFPFALLGVLSKENGALLLLLIVVFELSVFRQEPVNRLVKIWFRVGVLLPLSVIALYLLVSFPSSLANFEPREFNMLERLLSEARVLTIYIQKIFVPTLSGSGLFHDDFQVSTSLFSPISTVGSLLFLVAIVCVAIVNRKNQPILFLGVAWFFALHVLESTYLPLDLYFEHRNYLPMIGPLITVVWYLNAALQGAIPAYAKTFTKIVTGMFLLVMPLQCWQQAQLWSNEGSLLAYWAEIGPDSIRAQTTYADYIAPRGLPEQAMERLRTANKSYPKEVTLQLHMWTHACEYDMEAPISLEQIAANGGLQYFHSDINFHLRKLLEGLIEGRCQYPERATMIALFASLEPLIRDDLNRAGYHFLFSDVFIYYRLLDPALIQLSKSFELKALPQVPIRQAMLAASADNNADALVFLERARVANDQLGPFLPSFELEIARIEVDIRNRMARSNDDQL